MHSTYHFLPYGLFCVYIVVCRTYASRLSSVVVRSSLVERSGLAKRAITIPRVVLRDGSLREFFYGEFLERVMGAVFVDSNKSTVAVAQVLKHLMELSTMPELIPPEEADPFGGVHPNQFFVTYCLKIGVDVEYKFEDLGVRVDVAKRFRCTVYISNLVMSIGYGSSVGASRAAVYDSMRVDPRFLDYCRQLKGAFNQSHSTHHSLERACIPPDPMAFITEFHRCSRREVESWLITVPLETRRFPTRRGAHIEVPRILSLLVRNTVLESLSIGPSKTLANQFTLSRYGASILHSIPMISLVKYDYVLLQAYVFSLISHYYPQVPFPLEMIHPYLPSTHPVHSLAVLPKDDVADGSEPPPKRTAIRKSPGDK